MADGAGSTGRKTWEGFAAQGPSHRRYAEACQELEGPPLPACMEYLYTWAVQLHGRSGTGMSGADPLTYATILAWTELMDVWPQPHEVETLLMLDLIMSHPQPLKEGEE